MDEEIIIWLDDKFSLTRKYDDYFGDEESSSGRVSWKLSHVVDGKECSLEFNGGISRHMVSFSHFEAQGASVKLSEGKSFELSNYFTDAGNSHGHLNIEWDPETSAFTQYICCDYGSSTVIFAFPNDGAKALVEDMTNLLKELKWTD